MERKQNTCAEAVWRQRLARFARGNWTVAEFCCREGVSNPSFYQWRKRLHQCDQRGRRVEQADSGTSTGDLPGCFLPVNVTGLSVAEMELPNGIKVRVPATNVELLRTAIFAGYEVCQEVAPC